MVIIDALRSSERAGEVRAIDPESLQQQTYLTSSHGFGVVEAVALAGQLGELPSRLSVIGIETGEDVAQLPAIEQHEVGECPAGVDRDKCGF